MKFPVLRSCGRDGERANDVGGTQQSTANSRANTDKTSSACSVRRPLVKETLSGGGSIRACGAGLAVKSENILRVGYILTVFF